MFKKKFRVRVVHFLRGRYKVQWAEYRIFPVWHTIQYWFDMGTEGPSVECWSVLLFRVREAENFAQKMKSKRHIMEYYAEQSAKAASFYRLKKWRDDRAVPYHTKEIITP